MAELGGGGEGAGGRGGGGKRREGERTAELGDGERIAGYLDRLYIGHRSGTLL